jgi:hypothetical protein
MPEVFMFRKMRRSKKEVFGPEIAEILNAGEYGVMSVHGDNGYPYGVPVNYVYMDEAIYFHCAGEGHKIDAIEGNPKVSFCVVSKTEIIQEKFTSMYKSVIAFGSAGIVTGEEKTRALMKLIEKYSPDFIEEGRKYIGREASDTTVVKIRIEEMKGKSGF